MTKTLLTELARHVVLVDCSTGAATQLSRGGLTKRERDVLALLAEGHSTREIATRLAYSERTIKSVVHSVTVRLQVRNRTQAVAHAIRSGWI